MLYDFPFVVELFAAMRMHRRVVGYSSKGRGGPGHASLPGAGCTTIYKYRMMVSRRSSTQLCLRTPVTVIHVRFGARGPSFWNINEESLFPMFLKPWQGDVT